MASGGWVAELDKKEHKNWVMVGCALNIAKNGITPKIQTELETWYQSLISSPSLQSLAPCTCAPRAPKCVTCVTWELELKRHHTSTRPKICWDNSDRKQWGSATGAWEIAKVFMPTLGSRKTHVIDADTTDIGGLLNLLEWCRFSKSPVSRTVLSLARDECRNHWAHAPKQELQDADVKTIFGHLDSLLSDPVFKADTTARKSASDLKDLNHQGLVNVIGSDVEALHLLRQSLVADLTKCQYDLADARKDLSDAKKQVDINTNEIDNLGKQLEMKSRNLSDNISTILNAVDYFNRRLNDIEVIRDDVEDVRNGLKELNQEVVNLKSQVQEAANKTATNEKKIATNEKKIAAIENKTATNENKISGLQKNLMEFREYVKTSKGNASQAANDDDGDMLCTSPRRLTAFTGRKSALQWLERQLVSESPENGPGTSCCTKTICGLGGCGKTSLAVEFAWSYRNSFPGGVFWINGESNENIQKSVVKLLSLVNIPASGTENIDDTLNRFLSWLSKRERRWLLVVDNADELKDPTCPTGVKNICRDAWQRNGNALKHGQILYTTRENAKDTRMFLKLSNEDCLVLQCFSEEEGALFLMQRTGLEGESIEPEAFFLANELGALPLALEQAAAYIYASPIPLSFKEYLDKYQAVKLRLLKQQPATALSLEAQHRLSIHTTWEMNFEYVKERSPAAATMMRIAAFLESEYIPIKLINPGFPELDQEELRDCSFSEMDIADILKALSSYSLFSVDNQTKVFGVHKLVQEVVRDSLTTSERTETLVACIRVLRFALLEFPAFCSKSGKSPKCFKSGDLWELKIEELLIVLALLLNFFKLMRYMEEEIKLTRGNYNRALFNDNTLELCEFVYSLTNNSRSWMRGDTDLFKMVNTSTSKHHCYTSENVEELKRVSENIVQKLIDLGDSDVERRVFFLYLYLKVGIASLKAGCTSFEVEYVMLV